MDYRPEQTHKPYNNLHIFIIGGKSVFALFWCLKEKVCCETGTVLPAKSDSDFMFCIQSYQGLIIDRSLVY